MVSLNSENGKKVAKLAKDSDIRKNGVEYNFAKKLDKFKFAFLSSEHRRKHNRVSDIYDKKTHLNSRNEIG